MSPTPKGSNASPRTPWWQNGESPTRSTASSTQPASTITTSPHRRVDFDTIGRDGLSLYDHWRDGFRTMHGLSSHGFPNWFTIGINQNGLSPNMTSMFDDQAVHVSYVIGEVLKHGKETVEVTTEAEDARVRTIVSLAGTGATAFLEECTPEASK